MSRRVVLTVKEIYLRRANNWEWHYKNYKMVCGLGTSLDREKIALTVARTVPVPVMQIDGDLIEGMDTIKGKRRALEALAFTPYYNDLMCAWYWSQAGWDAFVNAFQSLPDVLEDHYLFYDAEADACLLMPMSSKEKRGLGTSQVHLSTTGLVVPEKRARTRFLAPRPAVVPE